MKLHIILVNILTINIINNIFRGAHLASVLLDCFIKALHRINRNVTEKIFYITNVFMIYWKFIYCTADAVRQLWTIVMWFCTRNIFTSKFIDIRMNEQNTRIAIIVFKMKVFRIFMLAFCALGTGFQLFSFEWTVWPQAEFL